ncbi:MAG: hypothetical protein U0946_03535 [Patescibacteria group bacterium]|nr:hypothetical protein [Patescibacteria group bacterium]
MKITAKRNDKIVNEGRVFSYVHHDGGVASLVKILCETDFVAKSEEFMGLGKEISMQVASMEPKNIKTLLKQAYIRDSRQTIADLLAAVSLQVKEKIEIKEIARMNV